MEKEYKTLESLESKQKHEIPSNIWETDCKYCIFRSSNENFKYGSRGRYEQPCKIGRFRGDCGIWDSESKGYKTEHEVYTEHCGSVRSHECFGICGTCHYFNSFHDDVDNQESIYCTHQDGALNRRNTMPWVHAGYQRKITSFDYTYFTCDRYRVDNHRWGVGSERLVKMALDGLIPMNFNPDTMQPLEHIDGEPIAEWKERQQKHEAEKPENKKKVALQDLIKNKIKETGAAVPSVPKLPKGGRFNADTTNKTKMV